MLLVVGAELLRGGIGADFVGGGVTAGLVYYTTIKLQQDVIDGLPGFITLGKNKVFALGWGLGAALFGLSGGVMAIFLYSYPVVRASSALIS